MCFDSIGEIPREPFLSVYSHFNPRCLNQHNIRKLFWGKKKQRQMSLKLWLDQSLVSKMVCLMFAKNPFLSVRKNQLKLKKSKLNFEELKFPFKKFMKVGRWQENHEDSKLILFASRRSVNHKVEICILIGVFRTFQIFQNSHLVGRDFDFWVQRSISWRGEVHIFILWGGAPSISEDWRCIGRKSTQMLN